MVHLDFPNLLPRTERGKECILIGWVCITTYKDCEGYNKGSYQYFVFSRFGYHFKIFSDESRNFETELFSNVCEMWMIHNAKTTL